MKLFEIANEYICLLDNTFNEETGEVNETVLSKLNEIKESVEKKSIALASYIKNLEAEKKAIEEAKKEMAKREESLEKKVEYLTTYLKSNMEKCEISEIKCPYFQIKLKKCPLSVDIQDESLIEEEYKRLKTVVSLDKVKIREKIIEGIAIPGARLVQNTRLEIR